MGKLENLLGYGIPNELSSKIIEAGLSVTSLQGNSQENLVSKFGLTADDARIAKLAVTRKAIDEKVVTKLLLANNTLCCVCQGMNGRSFVIHHIREYHKSQDNSYDNLAVLCPTCHDKTHSKPGLTSAVSDDFIRQAKAEWEALIVSRKRAKASFDSNMLEVDFFNYGRLVDLAYDVFKCAPETTWSKHLSDNGLLLPTGYLNEEYIRRHKNSGTYLLRFSFSETAPIRRHFREVFEKLLIELDFVNLDSLLKVSNMKPEKLVGKYCYFVGGLTGSYPGGLDGFDDKPVQLYYQRKPFKVTWLVDPVQAVSTTSLERLSRKNRYIIYGIIRNLAEFEKDGVRWFNIDVRYYLAGMPPYWVGRPGPNIKDG